VSLSLKATQEDPWQRFAREHAVGEIVDGEVTKLVPFGAFVKVADGIEGLVHISELAERHVEVPEAVVNVGDKIEVKVIDIDTVRRRISLSLQQAQARTRETSMYLVAVTGGIGSGKSTVWARLAHHLDGVAAGRIPPNTSPCTRPTSSVTATKLLWRSSSRGAAA